MKQFLPVLALFALVACESATSVGAKIDSAAADIKNSPAVDSLGAKAGRFGDSVDAKGERIWDSTKAKGGRLVNSAADKLDDIKISLDSNKK